MHVQIDRSSPAMLHFPQAEPGPTRRAAYIDVGNYPMKTLQWKGATCNHAGAGGSGRIHGRERGVQP